MRNIYRVKTPENVTLEFELAGIGSRSVAVIIDTIVQNIILLIIILIVTLINRDIYSNIWYAEKNTPYIVVSILLVFIVQFGYYMLFEYFSKGSTLGKKIVGLKVIMANGEPISFTAALVRNLLRIGDMLPGIYGVGIFSVFFSQRYMRVGDLAANTIVIKVKNGNPDFLNIRTPNSEQHNISINPKEEALLMEYSARLKDRNNPLYSIKLENQLYNHFYNKVGIFPNLPEKFDKKTYLKCLLDYIGIS